MKNPVKNPLSKTNRPAVKSSRAPVQKEYYLLRDDVFQFIGIVTATSLPILTIMQETAEACTL